MHGYAIASVDKRGRKWFVPFSDRRKAMRALDAYRLMYPLRRHSLVEIRSVRF